MQVPSEPLQYSHSRAFMPLRGGVIAEQLPWVQVASNVTVSPAQPVHVHVVDSALGVGDVVATISYMHGGHSSVAAQQPLEPGLEPSAHFAAEAFGHAVPCMLQALQAAHSGLFCVMELHVVGQHGVQSSTALAEIRPLLEIDTFCINMLELQAVAAA